MEDTIKKENVLNKVKFNTSEKILVTQIDDGYFTIDKLSTKTNSNIKVFQNHRSLQTRYKKFVDKINSIEYKFKIHKMKVKKIDDLNNLPYSCQFLLLEKNKLLIFSKYVN